jgi:predicted metalloprotease
MRWRKSPGDASGIEDRRGSGGGGSFGRIPGGRIGGGIGGAGIVGLIVALLVVFLGGGGGRAFDIGTGLDAPPEAQPATENVVDEGPDPLRDFVGFVVADIQDHWDAYFAAAGERYPRTRLVLFANAVSTAGCGDATSATGPFYCPTDRLVYLDLGFFRELEQRFGAPGDFAQAYVIAHEFGHHVQNVLGTMGQVQVAQRRDPGSANDLSVRLELQADCYAGVWAHSAFQEDQLEEGDLEEGLNAAAAVGDDRLQEQAGVRVDRETFTHGSSQERRDWFLRGFEEGTIAACDTFA